MVAAAVVIDVLVYWLLEPNILLRQRSQHHARRMFINGIQADPLSRERRAGV